MNIKNIIYNVIFISVGVTLGIIGERKKKNSDKQKMEVYANKHLMIMKMFDRWMSTKQEGKSIAAYLNEQNKKTVAIYGMSYLGRRLYDELKYTTIDVKYGIDQEADDISMELDLYKPNERLPEVDCIIVTAVYYFDEIEEKLSQVVDCEIVCFEDILYEL